MIDLDVYYRALQDYRAVTRDVRSCASFRQVIARTDTQQDQVLITRNICTVDEDWIQAIEAGLVFVEKAIKEDRQFIYSEGEVREIEKVKNFSSESVRHLAKHSNLITREQEGDNIVPDKLYTVERLSDYTVYENRFLYMLLCYLRDFVTLRYNKILDLTNKYDGSARIDKQIDLPKQKMSCTIELHDERRDDDYLRQNNTAQSAIDRIDLILKTVLAFLATPLMEITGKAPMLKPPITKTNVLKMDNNFKGAVALYDYIIAYDKPGYTIETKQIQIAPFTDALAEDMSEAVALLSFLTYSHGLDLGALLQRQYESEQNRRAELKIQKAQQQAEALKRRLAAMEISPEEYIAALEAENRLLRKENQKLAPIHAQLERYAQESIQLKFQLSTTQDALDALQEKLEGIEQQHQQQMDALRQDHNAQILALNEAHAQACQALEAQAQAALAALREEMEQKLSALQQDMDQQLAALRQVADDTAQALRASQAQAQALMQECNALKEEISLWQARIKAVHLEYGHSLDEEDFTQQENFEQLEKEFEALFKFYRANWGLTKKKIRRELLNYKYLKEMNRQ